MNKKLHNSPKAVFGILKKPLNQLSLDFENQNLNESSQYLQKESQNNIFNQKILNNENTKNFKTIQSPVQKYLKSSKNKNSIFVMKDYINKQPPD